MVTYLYWFLLVVLVLGVFMGLGVRFGLWKLGFIAAGIIGVAGVLTYYFYLEQIFVKRYGGVMPISTPDNRLHLGITWKDDNLWVESWDPQENKCYFTEYSRSHVLQGSVVISDCNPLQARGTVQTVIQPAPAVVP
ncbi:MAG: hypothetical protein ACOY33_12345 [Pseudomonadota bacterium]